MLLHWAIADFGNVDDYDIKDWGESNRNNPGYRVFIYEEILQGINRGIEAKDEGDGDKLMSEEHVSLRTVCRP